MTKPSESLWGLGLRLAVWSLVVAFLGGAWHLRAQNRKAVFQRGQRVDAYVVTIAPEGMFPARITRQEGPFILLLQNRSRVPEVRLVLTKKGFTDARLFESEHKRQKADLDYALDLEPGEYTLVVRQKPEWKVDLVILPK